MKKFILSAFIIILLSTSCAKSDDNTSSTPTGSNTPPPTKTELLTDKNWVLAALTVNGEDKLSTVRDCKVDDIHIFKTDITYTLDEGPTKCNATDPQIAATSLWEFLDNETKIKFRRQIFKLVELTDTKFVVEFDSGSLLSVFTYTAK
jgi:hypothetical protein